MSSSRIKNIIKQIYLDENSNRIFIFDNQNNSYECNLYGDKLPKYLPEITGRANFQKREEKNQIMKLNFETNKCLYRPQTSN